MTARLARLLAALLATAALTGPLQAQGSSSRGARSAPAAEDAGEDAPAPRGSRARGSRAKAAPAPGLPGGGQAQLVASFGDWGVYQARAEGAKLCYAASQPKDRLPKGLNRDPAYLFVTFRQAPQAKGEVAMVLGFAAKDGAAAEAAIGSTAYALVTKGANAWLKTQAEDGPAITTMQRGQSLTVKAVSGRGNQLTDRYSLTGFGQALERARKECGAAGA